MHCSFFLVVTGVVRFGSNPMGVHVLGWFLFPLSFISGGAKLGARQLPNVKRIEEYVMQELADHSCIEEKENAKEFTKS
jgi:hypothetical protein